MHQNNPDLDDPRFRIHPSQQVISSCSGALVTSLFMTPLDVVKTRLQAQQRVLLSNKCFLYCNGLMDHLCPCGPTGLEASRIPKFTGTFDAFLKIGRTEGVKSLWSGLSPTLVLALPTTVIYFVAYEQLRVRMKDQYLKWCPKQADQKIPFTIPLLAGSSARTLAVSIVSPLELVRTKMQSQKLSYLEVGQALRSLVQQQGVFGLWKGLRATLLRDVPFSGIYWTSYESIKSYYNVTNPTILFSFVGGAAAGSIAAFLTTPFDVVKTHKQIELGEKMIYTDKPNVPSDRVLPTIQRIFRTGGVKGLFAGVLPRLLKVAPACAIMIASFEYGKAFFYNHNIEKWRLSEDQFFEQRVRN